MRAVEFASVAPELRLNAIADFLRQDARMVQYAGLFARDGHPIAGNLANLPPDLKVDGPAQESVFAAGSSGDEQIVGGIARRLPNGDIVVVGRNIDEAVEIEEIVLARH